MYSHVFNFRFNGATPSAERMRFLADLLDIPPTIGLSEADIYWLKLSIKGEVEFYSNRPHLTTAIWQRLDEAEAQGILQQTSPGLRSVLTFCWRLVAGFATLPFRYLK